MISPLRVDPFANGGATPDVNARGYGQIMREQNLKRDQADYDFRNAENNQNRIAQLVNTAIASDPDKYGASVESIQALIGAIATDLSS